MLSKFNVQPQRNNVNSMSNKTVLSKHYIHFLPGSFQDNWDPQLKLRKSVHHMKYVRPPVQSYLGLTC